VDSFISMPTFNGLRRNHRLATNDPVAEEQAPLPQSALASLRRGGRSRSTHWASLAEEDGIKPLPEQAVPIDHHVAQIGDVTARGDRETHAGETLLVG
jgi:hypothetical protein